MCFGAAALAAACGAAQLASASWSFYDPLPPYIAEGMVWQQVYPTSGWLGNGSQRVAIVVWEDMTVAPAQRLYAQISSSIDAYAEDVAASGFKTAVFKFYGMAELWPQPDPPDLGLFGLRDQLHALYQQAGSLSGAVLVGNVPYVLGEEVVTIGGAPHHIDYPSDIFLADLDGELRDDYTSGNYREGVFDNIDGHETEIWISRIMARPGLVNFVNQNCTTPPPAPATEWTQELLLQNYFARNAFWRWNAFNTDNKSLYFSPDPVSTELQDQLGELFGPPHVMLDDPPSVGDPPLQPTPPDAYLEDFGEGYAHVHIAGYHGDEHTHVGPTGDLLHKVWREHYVVPDYAAPGMQVHYDCAGQPTMSFILGTCDNAEIASFTEGLAGDGRCCFGDGTCRDDLSQYDCTVLAGRFSPQVTCEGDPCPAWVPPWPLVPPSGSDNSATIAEVLAFNPDMRGLLVLGHSKATATVAPIEEYYQALLDGGCAGDGLKATYNDSEYPSAKIGFILLGDGTLKSGLRWNGDVLDPYHYWDYADNWSAGRPPSSSYYEAVLHNNGDEIQMNNGVADSTTYVRRYEGDGADGGGLRIWSRRDLEVTGDAIFHDDYAVALEPGIDAQHPTQFSIGGTLSGLSLSLPEYSALSVGLSSDSASMLEGNWTDPDRPGHERDVLEPGLRR
jgi:hypothetical protein